MVIIARSDGGLLQKDGGRTASAAIWFAWTTLPAAEAF
jgi:hypothetical protein